MAVSGALAEVRYHVMGMDCPDCATKIERAAKGVAGITDTAALFQALGGGWWNRTPPGPEEQARRLRCRPPTPQAKDMDGKMYETRTLNGKEVEIDANDPAKEPGSRR